MTVYNRIYKCTVNSNIEEMILFLFMKGIPETSHENDLASQLKGQQIQSRWTLINE